MASEDTRTSGPFTVAHSSRIRRPRTSGRKNPVILMTGGAGVPLTARFTNIRHLALALEAQGYSVFMCDVADCYLGGDPAEDRIADTVAYAATFGLTGAPILLGQSNGASASLRYIAEGNPVAGAVLVLPPLAMDYAYQNDFLGLRASIEAGYSITYPTPIPEVGDPLLAAEAGLYNGVPIQVHYSTDDALTIGEGAVLTDFLADLPLAEAFSLGALGHTSTACEAVVASVVVQFVKRNTN